MAFELARALLAAGLALLVAVLPGNTASGRVVVGSKVDTEGALIGTMIVELLRAEGIPVDSRIQLGPTRTVRKAILDGDIDLYPEYTANAGLFFDCPNDPEWHDRAEGFERARALDAPNSLVWLTPAPANNTWAIALRRDVADANNVRTLDDFSRWIGAGGTVKLAGSQEFVESPAALPAFESAYRFSLTPEQVLVLSGGDTAATIRAAAERIAGVNAAMAYGTDGALSALGLVILSDTKGVQPVYSPAPVVRAEILQRYPRIGEILAPLFRSLTLETLQALNARVALGGIDAKAVAREYLAETGLVGKAPVPAARH